MKILGDTPARFVIKIIIVLGMSYGVNRGSEFVGKAGLGCDAEERESDFEAADRAGGRDSEATGQARILYCISIPNE